MDFEALLKKLSPTIKRIAYKLSSRYLSFSHEDLYQEAVIFLWTECKKGSLCGKTDSYILQGCYFALRNFIRTHLDRVSLVSLDAPSDDEDADSFRDKVIEQASPRSVRQDVHCAMLIEQIRNNGLTPREKDVFNCLLEGLTTREIGQRLGVSHVMVVKLTKGMRAKCLEHINDCL